MGSIRDNLKDTEPKYDIEPIDYRLMFDSPHGQKVLAHMLFDMHFIEEIKTPAEMERRNTLIRMLNYAGILSEKNLTLLAKKLLEVSRIGR